MNSEMNCEYQSVKNPPIITNVVLLKSTTTTDQIKNMKDKVENGYLFIIPDVDSYELIGYTTHWFNKKKYIEIKLLNKNINGCFGCCIQDSILNPYRPGVYRMQPN
jgi:hypothetical protein